jgi:hypothetical protein
MKEAFTLGDISHPSHFLFFLIFSISLYLFLETPTFFFKTVKEKIENGFLECYMCCTMRPPLWARKAAIEQDKLLKGGSDEILSLGGIGSSGFVHVNITTTVFFVVIASCSLAMLYKLLSTWFIKLCDSFVITLQTTHPSGAACDVFSSSTSFQRFGRTVFEGFDSFPERSS